MSDEKELPPGFELHPDGSAMRLRHHGELLCARWDARVVHAQAWRIYRTVELDVLERLVENRYETCEACEGWGKYLYGGECRECSGTGGVPDTVARALLQRVSELEGGER